MSLAIDSRYITAVYALGQWFEIEDDSLCVDAYEFTYWDAVPDADTEDFIRDSHTDYLMGSLYQKEQPEYRCIVYDQNSRDKAQTPQGCDGVSFIEKTTRQRVSFSLMEVKAFRERSPLGFYNNG